MSRICLKRVAGPSFFPVPGAFPFPRHHSAYDAFARIDGRHPYRDAVPGGHVDYRARRRRDGGVAYFNYGLAREMGLIPAHHPDKMTQALRAAILDAFALVIVNEYDVAHRVNVSARDLRPHPYMATRYLQLQHPGKRGTTSGDGRSVWNGTLRHAGVTWDISSCGTGVTRLCPATAETNRFYKTGSRTASYGCGTASVEEGLAAAVMSEVLHRNGIPTERVLAVIAFSGGFAVNVRAARNLLRPSHLFAPLKQNDLTRLKAAVDYAIARERKNGNLGPARTAAEGYRAFAEAAAAAFGRAAAIFEREYVFCWLDWDGDNVLLDGAIVDYGSVRQFGLYHREYRFDDGPRWSTTIPEQRAKARAIVRCFAQIADALIAGRRAPLAAFRRDPLLAVFDDAFLRTKDRLLIRHMGFDPSRRASCSRGRAHWFALRPRAPGARDRPFGPRASAVPDGITWTRSTDARSLRSCRASTRAIRTDGPRDRPFHRRLLVCDASRPAAHAGEAPSRARAPVGLPGAHEARGSAHRAEHARRARGRRGPLRGDQRLRARHRRRGRPRRRPTREKPEGARPRRALRRHPPFRGASVEIREREGRRRAATARREACVRRFVRARRSNP